MTDTGVLAMSLDGQLRIRELGKFGKGVVELRCADGSWMWCVWHACEMQRAWDLFHNQTKFHAGPHPWVAAYYLALTMIIDFDLEPTSALREIAHEMLGLPWGEQVGEFVIYGCKRIES